MNSSMEIDPQSGSENAWHIANRWQEFAGEMRSAVLRAVLVVVFYSIQLAHFCMMEQATDADRFFHRSVTFASAAWLMISMAVLIALRGGFMPPALKYIVTAMDLILVTLLAWLGHRAESPLVTALFLVVALSAIRFRIGLIWFATIGAMVCYLLLVGTSDPTWFDANHNTPLITQAITLCTLASTGIVLGQIVRSARSMTTTFSQRLGRQSLEVQP